MWIKLVLIAALSLFAASAKADVNETSNSICRINAGIFEGQMSCGTGFAYKEDNDYYYILTAGHLIGIKDGVTVSLFHEGVERSVGGELVFHTYDEQKFETDKEVIEAINRGDRVFCNDVAVIKVKKSEVNGLDPSGKQYSPLKLLRFWLDYPHKSNYVVWTYGCPEGNWPTAYKGRLRKKSNYLIQFTPAAVQGRSGSPLLEQGCNYVIGIVTMCANCGHASNIDTIYQILKEQGLEPDVQSNTNSGPGPTKI